MGDSKIINVFGTGIEKATPVLKESDNLKTPEKIFMGSAKKVLAASFVARSKAIRPTVTIRNKGLL